MTEKERISKSIKENGEDAKCGHHGNLLHGNPCPHCFPEYSEQSPETGQVDAIVMRKDQAIDKLRGQLQNCVNHLHNAKRKLGSRYDFDEAIDHANKTLYDTLDA